MATIQASVHVAIICQSVLFIMEDESQYCGLLVSGLLLYLLFTWPNFQLADA